MLLKSDLVFKNNERKEELKKQQSVDGTVESVETKRTTDRIITSELDESLNIENLDDIVKGQDAETAIKMLIQNMKR